MSRPLPFRGVAVVVIVFSAAIAYLEAAVVVYLTEALGGEVGVIFPLRPAAETGDLMTIEVGREAATLVIIATVGILVGRTWTERLAWSAVVFGAWDIGYYGWLLVFTGWPSTVDTVDLLFLIPVPWVGPIWSPILVSTALIGVGLAVARRLRLGWRLRIEPWHWLAGMVGGLIVVLSYTAGFGPLIDGALPGPYPWPMFVTGMALALAAALDVLIRGAVPPSGERPSATRTRLGDAFPPTTA